jgi:hypothetical protein
LVADRVWRLLLTHLANNLGEARTGFRTSRSSTTMERNEFVEVKGPGDQLKNDQRN